METKVTITAPNGQNVNFTYQQTKKVELTYKQERQIISFFENSHRFLNDPENIEKSAIISLFRACKDYCIKSNNIFYNGQTKNDEHKQKIRSELINKLDILSVRYYGKI